jgi:hypothetical protein
MSASSSVRHTRLATRETTYGTPISSAGRVIRRTGGNFAVTTTAGASKEVRTDLQSTQTYRTNQASTYTIEDEWVYGVHNYELEDHFLNTWSPLLSSSVTTSSATAISAASSDNSFNRATGDFTVDGVVVGAPIKTGGFTNAGNNGVFRVVSVTALKIIVAGTLITEAAGTNSLVVARYLRQGTTDMFVTFEEYYSDLATPQYIVYPGMVNDMWEWKFSHPGEITTKFDYKGRPPIPAATTGSNNGTITAYAANPVMNSSDSWKVAIEGGTPITVWVKDFTITCKNNKREIGSAGTLGAKLQGKSTFDVAGQVVLYNDANGLLIANKHFAFTDSAWEFQCIDALGNTQHFYIPKLNYTAGAPLSGPKDQDVMITLPFTAKQDPVTGTMIQISAFS